MMLCFVNRCCGIHRKQAASLFKDHIFFLGKSCRRYFIANKCYLNDELIVNAHRYSSAYTVPVQKYRYVVYMYSSDQRHSILIDWRLFAFSVFSPLEGDLEYTGCGNTEHRGLKARLLAWLPSCPD